MTGISSATVARALCGNGYVSKEKKELIMAVAKQINYRPNLSARTLRNNCTEKILLGIPDICNAFYFRMIEGITAELDKYGYYPIIFNTQHLLEKELKLIDLLSQKYADGLILVSFNFTDKNIAAIRDAKFPVVLTNRYEKISENDNFDFVYSDHILGMEMVTEHMIKRGCKKILLISGEKNEQTSFERILGYKNILKKYNIDIDENYILNGNFQTQTAYNEMVKFIDSENKFDGIITANELMFMGVMRFISEGRLANYEIKLASFDNTDFSRNLDITSLDLKQDDIGRQSVKLLMERIIDKRKKSQQIYITPKLIIRHSTCK